MGLPLRRRPNNFHWEAAPGDGWEFMDKYRTYRPSAIFSMRISLRLTGHFDPVEGKRGWQSREHGC